MDSNTLAELKAMCKERGLPTGGKKADLVQRLSGVAKAIATANASEPDFRTISHTLTDAVSLTDRKDKGIFFTPKKARDRIWDLLGSWVPNTVLEPSFGSGEFLLDAAQRFPAARLFGNELEAEFHEKVAALNIPNTALTCGDFRTYATPEGGVDFIVGNPPYFVVKDKEPACMKGRGNMFVLFVYWSITKHLKEGGKLAFVLPTSFYNCAYYEPCRRFLATQTTLLHVENIQVNYLDTNQDTMILLVEKRAPVKPNPFVWERAGMLFLTPHADALMAITEGSTTLDSLGYDVKTGDVVWNQHKDLMSDDGVPVIYSTNITNGRVVWDVALKNGKKQYIKGFTGTPTRGPAILISRGYGNKYKFVYGVIESDMEFFGENHTNVISAKTEEAKQSWARVKASLENPKTAKFIELFVGNGALSKTELQELMPIF
jgi:adenine-specific DNA-methyltransferase